MPPCSPCTASTRASDASGCQLPMPAGSLSQLHIYMLFLINEFVYAQVVRQADGRIVAAASSIEKALAEGLPSTSDKDACSKVGSELAQRAVQAGLDGVQWLRKPGQHYHGRIAALITAMQEGGLPLYAKSKSKAAG